MNVSEPRPDFRYVEGRCHFDVYTVGDDRSGLFKAITREMYARHAKNWTSKCRRRRLSSTES